MPLRNVATFLRRAPGGPLLLPTLKKVGKMRVILESGDKPEVRNLIVALQKCGVEFEIVDETERRVHRCFTDKELKEAILEVMPCFSVKSQWVAVYRVLVDYCGFPAELTAFCDKIVKLMRSADICFHCDYQAIQKPLSAHLILQKPYCEWMGFEPRRGDRVFLRQKTVADRLMERLGLV